MPFSDAEVHPPPPPPSRPTRDEVLELLRSKRTTPFPWLTAEDVANPFETQVNVSLFVAGGLAKLFKRDMPVEEVRKESIALIRKLTQEHLDALVGEKLVESAEVQGHAVYKAYAPNSVS